MLPKVRVPSEPRGARPNTSVMLVVRPLAWQHSQGSGHPLRTREIEKMRAPSRATPGV